MLTNFIAWICWKLKWGWVLEYEKYSDERCGDVIQLWVNSQTGQEKERVIRWF
jgi:hypothetical protein